MTKRTPKSVAGVAVAAVAGVALVVGAVDLAERSSRSLDRVQAVADEKACQEWTAGPASEPLRRHARQLRAAAERATLSAGPGPATLGLAADERRQIADDLLDAGADTRSFGERDLTMPATAGFRDTGNALNQLAEAVRDDDVEDVALHSRSVLQELRWLTLECER